MIKGPGICESHYDIKGLQRNALIALRKLETWALNYSTKSIEEYFSVKLIFLFSTF